MTPNVKLGGVTDLDFADPHTGWALGSVMQGQVSRTFLLQTVDGGATWAHVYPYGQFQPYPGTRSRRGGYDHG
jgi:photosystem II stability/assembly factor-like uncharacterized protein